MFCISVLHAHLFAIETTDHIGWRYPRLNDTSRRRLGLRHYCCNSDYPGVIRSAMWSVDKVVHVVTSNNLCAKWLLCCELNSSIAMVSAISSDLVQ